MSLTSIGRVCLAAVIISLAACGDAEKDLKTDDASTTARDAGEEEDGSSEPDDAAMDDGGDVMPEDSGGAPEGGSECSREGAVACVGNDSTARQICEAGRWRAADACAADERCDTRAGSNEGTCAKVAPECLDRTPSAKFCSGGQRKACGPDRITVTSVACAAGELCSLAQGETVCVADDNECKENKDDCDDDPNACVNVVGGFKCECPRGYQGTGKGAQGCTDVDECGPGVQTVCGENGIACANLPGAYQCGCSAGYEAARAQPCKDRDECAPGAVAACGRGATACTNLQGSHSCACDASHQPSADKRRCVSAEWALPALLESQDVGAARFARVAGNRAGDRVAVWQQADGTRWRIWANHYRNGVWGAPVSVEADPNSSSAAPQVAIDGAGNALASWRRTDDDGLVSIRWNRYTVGTGWGTPSSATHDDDTNVPMERMALDPAGNGVAVWTRGDRLWAVRYSVGTGVGSPTALDNAAGTTSAPAVAMDGLGNATVLWVQYDEAADRYDLWSSRFTISAGWGTAVSVENDDVDSAYAPVAAANQTGEVMAVWGQASTLRSSRLVSGAWTPPAIVQASPSSAAALAMDDAGNAIATWVQNGGVLTSRYTPASGWGTAGQILNDYSFNNTPAISVSPTGAATIAWDNQRTDGVWVARFSPATGWGASLMLSPGKSPDVAVDGTGKATAVWQVMDSGNVRSSIWTANSN